MLQTPIVPVAPAVQSALVQHAGAAIATHRFVPAQLRYPPSHAMPQLVPLQLAAPCEVGSAHAEQRDPHVPTFPLGEQMPLQLCVLAGHMLLHARLLAMHAPLQSCVPPGQLVPHDRPSQVAEPPVGTAQAEHEVGPQLVSSVLATHVPVPGGHW